MVKRRTERWSAIQVMGQRYRTSMFPLRYRRYKGSPRQNLKTRPTGEIRTSMMNTTDAINLLKNHKQHLTRQQYSTIKGQCIAGNIDGAIKGLRKILKKQGRDM